MELRSALGDKKVVETVECGDPVECFTSLEMDANTI